MTKRLPLIMIAAVLIGCEDDPTSPSPVDEGLETLRKATSQYQDVNAALADGFIQAEPCTENPEGPGALGIPYVNPSRLDATIDLDNPEVLFYEPQEDGSLELVGVEIAVPIEQWEEQYDTPPSVLGEDFHRNDEAGLFGIHIWTWRDSSDGVFSFWHPDVSCQHADS